MSEPTVAAQALIDLARKGGLRVTPVAPGGEIPGMDAVRIYQALDSAHDDLIVAWSPALGTICLLSGDSRREVTHSEAARYIHELSSDEGESQSDPLNPARGDVAD
ncbi:hypothetical protein CLV30_106112 [Haloactinopolyspora alba]|uniref:Uncharacterized protein n=1 Tax=Haloactinopolyspora alba TaxID=648780 RepID=A0A2P8E3R6_9ACTN|nr:hypothetical protein [Haloactinopolyspora alba]PSL04109.1 hypothetical protein CLV30_106112 [Haloactinopolyspora alba]